MRGSNNSIQNTFIYKEMQLWLQRSVKFYSFDEHWDAFVSEYGSITIVNNAKGSNGSRMVVNIGGSQYLLAISTT